MALRNASQLGSPLLVPVLSPTAPNAQLRHSGETRTGSRSLRIIGLYPTQQASTPARELASSLGRDMIFEV